MRKPDGQSLFLGSALIGGLTLVVCLTFFYQQGNGQSRRTTSRATTLTLVDIPFDGKSAFAWIDKLCQLGPRGSGSPGMKQQQAMLVEHFQKLGGQVQLQQFRVRHPVFGFRVPMANLIVTWHPERRERILLCAHYDTRPYPDEDASDKDGVFLGANDGASGVAVLAELAQHMPKLNAPLGIDFVLFDGEEFVFDERDSGQPDRYFLGSEYFARNYAKAENRGFQYRAAVLLDMVGDKYLELYQERNGLRWRDSRWIVESIWKKAATLGVHEFIDRPLPTEIRDDHLMLHKYGGIPACDIIDFNYRSPDRRQQYWHTRQDTPDKCSALSLAKVGWVLHEWLKDQK